MRGKNQRFVYDTSGNRQTPSGYGTYATNGANQYAEVVGDEGHHVSLQGPTHFVLMHDLMHHAIQTANRVVRTSQVRAPAELLEGSLYWTS